MKYIRCWLTYTTYIFFVECAIIAAMIGLGWMEQIPFATCAFALILMAFGTSAVVVLRDALLADHPWLGNALGMLGCCAAVLCVGVPLGWMQLEWGHLLYVAIITVAVYLIVWLLCVIQNRRDADEMNATLAKLRQKKR